MLLIKFCMRKVFDANTTEQVYNPEKKIKL